MVTLFAVPKAFRGMSGTIQRNAIRSWITLRPKPEILLLGDEEGTAEAAREFGATHVEGIRCNELGTPLVDSVFASGERAASHDVLCYINADILLLDGAWEAMQLAARMADGRRFLAVGRSWDIEPPEESVFEQPDWQERIRARVHGQGTLRCWCGIEYFLFPKGLFGTIPAFAIGRSSWDNWLIYRARASGAMVIDATRIIMTTHQTHDYSHHAGGRREFVRGPEFQRNLQLAGGARRLLTIADATHELTSKGVRLTRHPVHWMRRLYTATLFNPVLEPLNGLFGAAFAASRILRPRVH